MTEIFNDKRYVIAFVGAILLIAGISVPYIAAQHYVYGNKEADELTGTKKYQHRLIVTILASIIAAFSGIELCLNMSKQLTFENFVRYARIYTVYLDNQQLVSSDINVNDYTDDKIVIDYNRHVIHITKNTHALTNTDYPPT